MILIIWNPSIPSVRGYLDVESVELCVTLRGGGESVFQI